MGEMAERRALAPMGHYDFSQDTGQFTVKHPSGQVFARGRFRPVATWSSMSGSWYWAWANTGFDAYLVEEVKKVRDWGIEKRIEVFAEPRIPCDREAADRLFATALHLMGAHSSTVIALTPTSWIYSGLFDIEPVASS
jgi:hypothetical protein